MDAVFAFNGWQSAGRSIHSIFVCCVCVCAQYPPPCAASFICDSLCAGFMARTMRHFISARFSNSSVFITATHLLRVEHCEHWKWHGKGKHVLTCGLSLSITSERWTISNSPIHSASLYHILAVQFDKYAHTQPPRAIDFNRSARYERWAYDRWIDDVPTKLFPFYLCAGRSMGNWHDNGRKYMHIPNTMGQIRPNTNGKKGLRRMSRRGR